MCSFRNPFKDDSAARPAALTSCISRMSRAYNPRKWEIAARLGAAGHEGICHVSDDNQICLDESPPSIQRNLQPPTSWCWRTRHGIEGHLPHAENTQLGQRCKSCELDGWKSAA